MSNQSAKLKAFENQIAPLADRLMRRCKHYGFPVMIAVSVPLAADHSMLAFHMEPAQDGTVPPDFIAARALLTQASPTEGAPQPDSAAADPAAADTPAGG